MPDFTPLFEAFVPSADGKNTSSFELPSTLLESIIPGYAILRKLALEVFGFDIAVLLSILGFVFLLRTALEYAWTWVDQILTEYCTCSIDMDEDDDPFESLMKWLLAKNILTTVRRLRAAGRWWTNLTESSSALQEMTDKAHGKLSGSDSSLGIFNYEFLSSNRPMGYEPDRGTYRFWHRGRLFWVTIYIKSYQHRHDDTLRVTLSCYGFSAGPIKSFLEEARSLNTAERVELKTEFFRAVSSESDWRSVSERPIRPLNTIALDTTQKLRIVRDLNSFVHPTAQKWYSARGIPYRRGYLFSGPPGTGKTSLSLALCGVFGLNLYAVSLQDNCMTEDKLTRLFDYLPERCIVLLEDIDSAGIGVKRSASHPSTPQVSHRPKLSLSGSDDGGRSDGDKPTQPEAGGISLAGLLNAIDGVASHEGHILIMTSNHPEKLDEALKRPGRVDLHIEFSLATKFQAREIFLRMFTDERPATVDFSAPKGGKGWNESLKLQTVEDVCRERSELADEHICPFMELEELDKAANAFVDAIPEKVFSPAEIQGYLLLHKMDPVQAVDRAAEWAEELLRVKRWRVGDTLGGMVELRIEDEDGIRK